MTAPVKPYPTREAVEDLLSKLRTDSNTELLVLVDAMEITKDPAERMELTRRIHARLKDVRRSVVERAEQLYKSASEATERTESALAEFDRQSEGALAAASAAVEGVRRDWIASHQSGGTGLARLEADLRQARANELLVLQTRTDAREPLEAAWRAAAKDLCQAGELLRTAIVPDMPAYVIDSQSAREALRTLHVELPPGAKYTFPGTDGRNGGGS